MKKAITFVFILIIVLGLVGCSGEGDIKSDLTFTEGENNIIISSEGTEYSFVGIEGTIWAFGKEEFIGHVLGEVEDFTHLDVTIKTGMYSVNGKQNVLVRYLPYNEFSSIYVKSDLLKSEVSIENCIRFDFVERTPVMGNDVNLLRTNIGDCKQFINEIISGQTADEAGLYDLVRQPSGLFKNCYVYGYICGIVQEDLDIVIPIEVRSFDDKAYSIIIDDTEYVLSKDWIEKLVIE